MLYFLVLLWGNVFWPGLINFHLHSRSVIEGNFDWLTTVPRQWLHGKVHKSTAWFTKIWHPLIFTEKQCDKTVINLRYIPVCATISTQESQNCRLRRWTVRELGSSGVREFRVFLPLAVLGHLFCLASAYTSKIQHTKSRNVPLLSSKTEGWSLDYNKRLNKSWSRLWKCAYYVQISKNVTFNCIALPCSNVYVLLLNWLTCVLFIFMYL